MNRKDFFKKGFAKIFDFAQENAADLVSGFQEIASKETFIRQPAPKKTKSKNIKKKQSFFSPNKSNRTEKERLETSKLLRVRYPKLDFSKNALVAEIVSTLVPTAFCFRSSMRPRKNIFLEWTSISTLVCFVKIGLVSTRVRMKR
ncbi:hypothetical protein LEP1GSC188_1645 [Leptospira weilii serovar Topaz str. LT2116]|uniref:Uncharacterized protein n=1 Tax=Leptospira weilii serovar Topaz str. LT2116 TaxID=1088540 RepID=M3GT30_9LEPT|nr:hypothetical protein LEP1GSC188_1645 [Leptospira weilii serovar Topaz str. LT2116]